MPAVAMRSSRAAVLMRFAEFPSPRDSIGMRHAESQVRHAALNARPAIQKVRRADEEYRGLPPDCSLSAMPS